MNYSTDKYPTYKPSNIDWIGEIPSHWDRGKLGFYSNVYRGSGYQYINIVDEDFEGKKSKVVRIGDFSDFNPVWCEYLEQFENYRIEKNNILVGGTGHYFGRSMFVTEEMEGLVHSYNIIRLVINTHFPKFIQYYISSNLIREQMDISVLGSGQPFIDIQGLKDLIVMLPPLPEQQSIVTYLDQKTAFIDELLAKKAQKIALLKEQRAAIINQAVTKGLNADAPLKDAKIEWIGLVPEHWEVVSLRHYYNKIGSGVTPKGGSENYPDEGIKFIRSQNVHFEGLKLDDVVFISEETHFQMKGSQVQKYDVLLNITGGSIGRCCIVELDDEFNVNQHVCIIRPKPKFDSYFLNYTLKCSIGQEQISFYITGGNREGLNFESIKNFLLTLPPLSEQQAIVAYLDKQTSLINKTIEIEQQKIATLKEYRQSLISNVVTGKVKVV